MIQQFYSWVYIQKKKNESTNTKWYMSTNVHSIYLQLPTYGSNPTVHQQMNLQRRYGIAILGKIKVCPFKQCGWT